MNTAMIDIFEKFVHEHMFIHIVLIALSVAALLLAMTVDFFTGLHKAKQNGVARTSRGLKKNGHKSHTLLYTIYGAGRHRPYKLCCDAVSGIFDAMGSILHILRI